MRRGVSLGLKRNISAVNSSQSVGISEIEFYWAKAWQVNAMTDTNEGTIGGLKATVSAFSTLTSSTGSIQKAFDNIKNLAGPPITNPTNFWDSEPDFSASKGHNWIEVDLGEEAVIDVTAYRITGKNVLAPSPKDFYLEGSNDATKWKSVLPVMKGQTTKGVTVCVFAAGAKCPT